MMDNRNEMYALSVSVANLLACNYTTPQLAVYASFFSSLAANLSVAIQTENFHRLCTLEEQPDATQSIIAETAIGSEEELE